MKNVKSFSKIGFEDFKDMAKDESLSKYEKIGFPNDYREGQEENILADIRSKLTLLDSSSKTVLDIGPGCSDLPLMLINLSLEKKHQLHLIDSEEMLSLLPNVEGVNKISALFPYCTDTISVLQGKIDVLLCYSVLHYILVDTAFYRFLDTALSMLAPGGQMLIGDIPNISKRNRFFSSENGVRFHQKFMKTKQKPLVEFNKIEYDQIDDAVLFSLLQRARAQGFDAYLVPQSASLPMANRREDILITRP